MKLPAAFFKGKSILQGDLGIWTVFFRFAQYLLLKFTVLPVI